jgi:hypothetical protein
MHAKLVKSLLVLHIWIFLGAEHSRAEHSRAEHSVLKIPVPGYFEA